MPKGSNHPRSVRCLSTIVNNPPNHCGPVAGYGLRTPSICTGCCTPAGGMPGRQRWRARSCSRRAPFACGVGAKRLHPTGITSSPHKRRSRTASQISRTTLRPPTPEKTLIAGVASPKKSAPKPPSASDAASSSTLSSAPRKLDRLV